MAVAGPGRCRRLGLLGNESLGGEEQSGDRGRVLQGRPGHLGRVDDAGGDQVLVLAGCGVEAEATLAGTNLLDDDTALEAGVDRDLADRLLHGSTHNGTPGLLVVGTAAHLLHRVLSTEQSDTAAGDNALFDGRTGRLNGVLDAVLLLLELDLGGRADLEHRDAARQLGQPLLQLLAVVVGVGVVDLLLDLRDATLDVLFLARTLDGSRFEEYKAMYGTSILTGWGSIHGFPVGVIANQQGVIFSAEAQKATEFILLSNRYDTPLLFIHNTTGYMVGKDYEQRGIIKDGAKMVNAVANSEVPHLTLMAGVSYGAGNYGMYGRSYDPRFVFGYPNHKVAVMGPTQLAGVMSIIARQAAEARGDDFDEEEDRQRTEAIEAQIEEEESAYFSTARVRDDGLIDPRDTRHVLGIALSATHSAEVKGTDRFGVFRM